MKFTATMLEQLQKVAERDRLLLGPVISSVPRAKTEAEIFEHIMRYKKRFDDR